MKLSANKLFWSVFLLCFILLLIIPLVRENIAGIEPYNNLKIAKSIIKSGFSSYDGLSYNGRVIVLNGVAIVTALLSYLFGLDFTSKLLPLVFGLVSLLLFDKILRKFKLDDKTRLISDLAFIISPGFIYLFNTLNSYFIPVFLGLLAFNFLLNNKKIISGGLLLVIPFFGFSNTIIILVLLLFYVGFVDKNLSRWFFVIILLSFIIGIFYYLPLIKSGIFSSFNMGSGILNLIFDLGSIKGIGIFSVILFLFGLKVLWKDKYKNLVLYLCILFLVVFSVYRDFYILYLNILISPIIATGIIKLSEIKWDSELIKNLTIFVLICGLLFTGLSSLSNLIHSNPSGEIIDGLEFLKENSKEGEVVISHYSRGYWISAIAERPVFMDSNFFSAPNLDERLDDSENLFSTRKLDSARRILMKNKISYILVDSEMKDGLVWSEDDEGLLFLLRVSKSFKKVYSNDKVDIWSVEK